jgi:hypothetical protein
MRLLDCPQTMQIPDFVGLQHSNVLLKDRLSYGIEYFVYGSHETYGRFAFTSAGNTQRPAA